MRRLFALSLAVMAFGFASNAGTVLYDNLAGTPLYDTYHLEKVTSYPTLPSPPPNYGPLFNSFSTPTYAPWTGATYSLTEVVVDLDAINPSDGATTVVGLYANNAGSPGALIATVGTLADSGMVSSFTDYALYPAPGITLLFDTTYWIGISSASSADSVLWALTDYNDFSFGLFNQHYKDAVYGVKPGFPLFEMQVDEDITTPEPAGYSILVFAIAAFATAKRRRASVGT
jgi:hypothetical protein